MALVKMYRDEPEVPGGNTEAMIPEEAVNSAMDNGWRLKGKDEPAKDESKPEDKKDEPKVEQPKADEPKVEPVKEEKSDFPEFEKSEGKKGKK